MEPASAGKPVKDLVYPNPPHLFSINYFPTYFTTFNQITKVVPSPSFDSTLI